MQPRLKAQETLEQAIREHLAGRVEAAETLYRTILDFDPSNPDAHFHLGTLALQFASPRAGLKHFRSAVETEPGQARYWLGYFAALTQAQEIASARQVLALGSKHGLSDNTVEILAHWLEQEPHSLAPTLLEIALTPAETIRNLPSTEEASATMISQFNQGKFGEIEQLARQTIICSPKNGFFWKVFGASLWQQGRPSEALEPMLIAAKLLPTDVQALGNLGATLENLGKLSEAETIYRQALCINANATQILNNLGDNLRIRNRHAEALPLLERALQLEPDFAEAHNNLGCLLHAIGNATKARTHLNNALRLRPDYPEALINLANLLNDSQQLVESEKCLRRALKLAPEHTIALNNLGNLVALQGHADQAEALLRKTLELRPNYHEARSNLLFNLNYNDGGSPSIRFAEAERYGKIVSEHVEPFRQWRASLQPTKLRIGLVSGDLRHHPVGYFLSGVLPHLSATDIELFAYPTQTADDGLSSQLRAVCKSWTPIHAFDDQEAANLIHHDGIHILLDLSGHTAHNRLPLFAIKPAPVQVSWLGYFATTGVSEIDYLLADAHSLPENQQGEFTERIYYLPDTRLCFSIPNYSVAVNHLPYVDRGRITFGSFQNLAKVNDRVINAWSAIIQATPKSLLRWQCKQFGDLKLRDQTLVRLEKKGIPRSQISLHGPTQRVEYLEALHDVDLILDTFPYPGGTTTCEALWMGVPTLTLAGNSMHARQGSSIMHAAGLLDWIANDESDYVRRAVHHAQGIEALTRLRAQLRSKVIASPIFDAPRFAENLRTALWAIWKAHSEEVNRNRQDPPHL